MTAWLTHLGTQVSFDASQLRSI